MNMSLYYVSAVYIRNHSVDKKPLQQLRASYVGFI
jgi:hypothetical protein